MDSGNCFLPAEILLPRVEEITKWAVIACDQFTSQPSYWDAVRRCAGSAPSTLHLILPEAELGTEREAELTDKIHKTMASYLQENIFQAYPDSYVYVERTLESGAVRKGLIGKVDLEAYDFSAGSTSPIRATEKTVVERIPPRMRVRRDAPLEFPHILMLADDHEKVLIEPIAAARDHLEKLYEFDLMEDGGHIAGWLVNGDEAAAFDRRLSAYTDALSGKYQGLPGVPMVFAVGDGNHSLATAKACYEELKAANPGLDLSRHPARYALVELENIHDDALVFAPIHRIVTGTDPDALLADLQSAACAEGGFPVKWYAGSRHGTIYLDRARSQLAVGALQSFLDVYLAGHDGEVDYIHGDSDLRELASQDGAIGFLLPVMEKSQLFRGVIADGVLPRKTFSMGHAREKRYYLEGRRITE